MADEDVVPHEGARLYRTRAFARKIVAGAGLGTPGPPRRQIVLSPVSHCCAQCTSQWPREYQPSFGMRVAFAVSIVGFLSCLLGAAPTQPTTAPTTRPTYIVKARPRPAGPID